jgi:pimeloyl-ACP methyl ester carboxylesterase
MPKQSQWLALSHVRALARLSLLLLSSLSLGCSLPASIALGGVGLGLIPRKPDAPVRVPRDGNQLPGRPVRVDLKKLKGSSAYQHAVEKHPTEVYEEFTLHTVEFNDEGWLWNRASYEQMLTCVAVETAPTQTAFLNDGGCDGVATSREKTLEVGFHAGRQPRLPDADPKRDVVHETTGAIVVVFAHGWQNDCRVCNEKLACFRELLLALYQQETALSERTHGLPRRIIGIYLAWRGETLRVPLIQAASFAGRKATAERIGGSGAAKLLEGLHRLRRQLTSEEVSMQLILIGHSYGGALLFQTAARGIEFQADRDQVVDRIVERQERDKERENVERQARETTDISKKATTWPAVANAMTDIGGIMARLDQFPAGRRPNRDLLNDIHDLADKISEVENTLSNDKTPVAKQFLSELRSAQQSYEDRFLARDVEPFRLQPLVPLDPGSRASARTAASLVRWPARPFDDEELREIGEMVKNKIKTMRDPFVKQIDGDAVKTYLTYVQKALDRRTVESLPSDQDDLVVLINPAFEASLYQQFEQNAARSYSPLQLPVFMVVSSDADSANKYLFPLGRLVGAIGHLFIDSWEPEKVRKSISSYGPYQTHSLKANDTLPADSAGEDCGCSEGVGVTDKSRNDWLDKLLGEVRSGQVVGRFAMTGPQEFTLTTLTPLREHSPDSDFMTVRTDGETIKRHGDAFNAHVVNFILEYSTILKIKRESLNLIHDAWEAADKKQSEATTAVQTR